MTPIRDRILARTDLNDLRAARDLDGLSAALNAQPELAPKSRFITERGIMAECKDGNAILDALEDAAPSNSAIRRAVGFLKQDAGLDIGAPYTLGMIQQLVAESVIPQDWADQLKALAMAPVLVSRLDVEAAMYNPDGSEK